MDPRKQPQREDPVPQRESARQDAAPVARAASVESFDSSSSSAPGGAGAPAGGGEVRRFSGSTWAAIAAVAFLAFAGYQLAGKMGAAGGSGAASGSVAAGESSPNYQYHQQAWTPPRLLQDDVDGGFTAAAVAAARRNEAIPNLPPPTPALYQQIQRGNVVFYRMAAWDTSAEDGDQVSVVVDSGVTYPAFTLYNRPQTLIIPAIGGVPPSITVKAEKDPGGGVTLGLQTSGGTWYSSVLPVGHTQTAQLGR